ncbi:hypothetical protein HDU76_008398, partial [Blyttiomyces sp. JEL0837]
VPVLVPVNYFSSAVSNNITIVLTEDGTSLSQLGLYQFSMSNIPDGSNNLTLHAFYVLAVTLTTWTTLYFSYDAFANLATTYLRSDNTHGSQSKSKRPAWRQNEAVQLRTVIVQNVPPHLRSDKKLTDWFEGLGIGKVDTAILDRSWTGAHVTRKLLDRRERTLKKLEVSYMQWVRNIEEEKRRRDSLYPVAGGKHDTSGGGGVNRVATLNRFGKRLLNSLTFSLATPGNTIRKKPYDETATSAEHLRSAVGGGHGGESRIPASAYLDEATLQSLRPKMSRFGMLRRSFASRKESSSMRNSVEGGGGGVDPDDAIVHYTNKLSQLTALVKRQRLAAFDPAVLNKPESNSRYSATAFVTFHTQRAAQIAAQVLLYTSNNPYTMSIQLAPAPQDINWSSISMHPIRRSIQSLVVTWAVFAFTFFWIVPASFFASFTTIEQLSKIPAFKNLVKTLAANQRLYFMVKTIGPPLIVNLFNMVIPYIIEFMVSQEGIEAHSWIETKTFSHYFFFLLFNVLLVFTLSSTVWNMIGTFFQNPISVFTIFAATLPAGATFFINYIIILVMFFPIELVRPAVILFVTFKKWTNKTPRELHELNLSSSYLNFGVLYPLHVLTFIIVLLYSVV